MIKKSLAFTIVLLICWSFFVSYKSFSLSQHQWQDNVISAEKFIFDIERLDNLIIGSSLARRLQMDSLPNFYNLSLAGQSIFDGLNILRSKRNLPKNVFIEINVIKRGENTNFKEIVSSRILNTLKRNLPIFRTDKQPLAYISNRFIHPAVNMFFLKIIYRVRDKMRFEFQEDKISNEGKPEHSIFEKMLALQIENYSAKIDTSQMDTHFRILKNHVDFLESKGVKVIFFEMPVNSQLVKLSRASYLRDRVKSDFPTNDFIKLPYNIDTYKTRDGVHLTVDESKTYTSYLKNEAMTVANI